MTPSDIGTAGIDDVLRSPLAKRKKMAAERSGASKLKEAFSAADIAAAGTEQASKVSTPTSNEDIEIIEEEEEEDVEVDEEDDFLARELGEDWG